MEFPAYSPYEVFIHKLFYKLNDFWTRTFHSTPQYVPPSPDAQTSSDMIYDLLVSDKPCMIARYGSTELYCLSNYLGIRQGWKNSIRFIQGRAEPWWWAPERVYNMRDFSGFFPIDEPSINRFCEMMLVDSELIDLLASWLVKENNVEVINKTPKIFLPYLEPWYADIPWTRVLDGKKIVVVHPFAKQIESQYIHHRTHLFANPGFLPSFHLRTVQAVQSLGGATVQGFPSWFEAMDWMKKELDKEDYDICLIGCGAYGFSLAAHVKRMGKKAVHMGGVLQLLFGIKGNRWQDPMYGVREWGLPENFYGRLFNEYWIKPGEETKPANAQQVEGACYW